MKFLGSSIPTTAFNFVLGNRVGGYLYGDTLKTLTHVDNSIETIDFGARKERLASLNMVQIAAADYQTIKDYLLNNSGKKIQIEQSTGDEIFGPNIANTFYAYLLDVKLKTEQGFEANNGLYEIEINLSYSGTGSSDEINPTSTIDFLIEAEINAIGYQNEVTLIADLAALPSPTLGDVSYVLEDKRAYYYNSVGAWEIIDEGVNLKQKIADNTTLGLTQGVFKWSAFADTTITETYYNKFISGRATVGYDGAYAVVHTDDADTDARQGIAIRQSDGTILISGANASDTSLCLRYDLGSTTPDAETTIHTTASGETGSFMFYDGSLDRWYCGIASFVNGLIKYSDDDGATWTQSTTAITDLPKGMIIASDGTLTLIAVTIGIGGAYTCWTSYDDAATWIRGTSFGSTPSANIRQGLLYDPEEDSVLTIVGGDGCYKSTDNGLTFTLISPVSDITSVSTECHKLIYSIENFKRVIYAVCVYDDPDDATRKGVLFKSVNNGIDWSVSKNTISANRFIDISKDESNSIFLFERTAGGGSNLIYDVFMLRESTDNFELIESTTSSRDTLDEGVFCDLNGLIYLSFSDPTGTPVFSSMTISQNVSTSNTFKSGLINKKSIQFPTSNINIDDGPAVETPQGFKFSLDNSDRKHIALSKYNFFGAKIRIYVYDNTGGIDQKVLIRAGINKNNSIDHFNFTFDVEPEYLFNKDFVLPDKVLSGSDLTSISGQLSESNKDLNLPLTYGRWKYGRLQSVIFNDDVQSVSIEVVQNKVTKVKESKVLIVSDVSISGNQFITLKMTSYSNDDVLGNIGTVYLNVLYGSGGATGSIKIDSYQSHADITRITLLTETGTSIANLAAGDRVELIAKSIKYCTDEVISKGFIESTKHPEVYYFDKDLNSYIQYPAGMFVTEDDFTGIEKTTQLKINVETYDNGLSSLVDKTLTQFQDSKDDMNLNVIDYISEGVVNVDKSLVPAFNQLTGESINLPIPSGGTQEFLFRKGLGRSDGTEATTSVDERLYTGNFGANARIISNGSHRWFLANDHNLNTKLSVYPQENTDEDEAENKNECFFYMRQYFNNELIFNEGCAFVRYLEVTPELRTELNGVDNVRLIFNQALYQTNRDNTGAYTSVIKGVHLVVQVVFDDGTKQIAFQGSFNDAGVVGDVQYTRDSRITSAIVFNNKPTFLGGKVQTDYTAGDTTTALSSGVTSFIGGDMVVLSSVLFDSVAYLFADVTAIQISFIPLSDPVTHFTDDKYIYESNLIEPSLDSLRSNTNNSDFYLSYEKTFDINNDTFFAKIDGGRVDSDGAIIERPDLIGQNIFNKKINKTLEFTGLDTRTNWKTRKQYFDNEKIKDIAREMSENLFCSAALKTDGSINFKSLNTSDYTQPIMTFDDSIVLKDSIIKIKFRKSTEIYNKFIFNYDWDWATESYKKQVVIYLDSDDVLQVDGLTSGMSSGLKIKYQDLFIFSKEYFGTGQEVTKTINLKWFYGDEFRSFTAGNWQPIGALRDYISKSLNYFIFNAWDFSFKVPMSYTIYNTAVTGNKVTEGDFIRFKSYYFSNDDNVDGFIKGIKPDYYNGIATITMICPEPPEIVQNFYDYRWDGETGDISGTMSDYQIQIADIWPFKDSTQVGTYMDGGTGDISGTMSDYQFDDDTYFDADEDYNPFDF